MNGFLLGRSTPQWLAVISGTLTFIGVLIALFVPALSVPFGIVAGAVVVLASIWLGFLTNTGTTPTWDARLQAGTSLTLTNAQGNTLTSVTLPTEAEVANTNIENTVKVPQLAEVPAVEADDAEDVDEGVA